MDSSSPSTRIATLLATGVVSAIVLARLVRNTPMTRSRTKTTAGNNPSPSTTTTPHRSFSSELSANGIHKFDHDHVIHPYTFLSYVGSEEERKKYRFPVVTDAQGAYLVIQSEEGGERVKVLDGISSWWSCLHGYKHPVLVEAMQRHLREAPSHVMFGGLTHPWACELISLILDLVPKPSGPASSSSDDRRLTKVFLADSGSISVEVSMKMAIQSCYLRDVAESKKKHNETMTMKKKTKFLTIKGGYHGDTFGTMGVCDPDEGMHRLFGEAIAQHYFVSIPECIERGCERRGKCSCPSLEEMRLTLKAHGEEIAGVILEPILQGAGGMRLSSPQFLRGVRELCDEFDVVMIVDEIATGFGRLGEMFACEYAGIVPDIMTMGKGLSGGAVSLAAVAVSERVSRRISSASEHPLMHGPTFMANPLACAVSSASIRLLLSSPWRERVDTIQSIFERKLRFLAPTSVSSSHRDPEKDSVRVVRAVRVLGAMSVIELENELDGDTKRAITKRCLSNHAVWLRPFGRTLYSMPPFNAPLTNEEVERIADAMIDAVKFLEDDAKRKNAMRDVSSNPEKTFA